VSGLANTATVAVSGYAEGYANVKITNLINGAPAALDTLHEIADSLNDNTDLAGSLTTLITNNTTSIDNLNIFDEVRVAGQDHVVATTNSDILTLAAGDNVTITTSAASDTITISATDNDAGVSYNRGEIRLNSASGEFHLGEIRTNSASGAFNAGLINNSGVYWLNEIRANSASGLVISGIASAGGSSLPHSSGDFYLSEIRTNSSSGNFNLTEIRANSASGAANVVDIRANSASGVTNANAINNSGVYWLGEIRSNSASGTANLTEIRANSASGNFNLTEIRANSASGVVISGIANSSLNAINNSGVFWLGEIQTNSASGAANLTEIRANSASGNFNLTEIRANSASGAANLTEIRANSASGTVNVNAINASGDFLLNEITTNSASGNFSAGSGIELHGKAFQAAVSGANLLATNTPTDNYVPSYDIATGQFTWVENAGGGGGGGSMTSVKSNGSAVGGSDIVTLDFSSDFGVAETPDTEINITIGTLNQNTTGSAATLTTARAIALAGDVTGTANFDGSVGISITSTIANDAVTYAKMQDTSADNRLLGAATAGTIGEVQVATAMIADDAVTYAKMQHTGTANRVLGAASAGVIGEVQVATDMVADDAVTYAKIQDVTATNRILGRDSAGAGVIEEITPANLRTMINVEDGATADQTKSDIDGLAITTVGTLAAGDATAIVSAASTTAAGKVELATTAETTTGTDTARAVTPDGLKDGYEGSTNVTTLGTIANGIWQGTAIAHAYIGDDAIDGDNIADNAVNSEHYVDGSIDTAHIDDDQVTYAKVQNVSATSRVLGRITSGAGVIEELTGANIRTIANVADGADVTSFVLEDDSGDEVTITKDKEVKFIGAGGLTINWTDTDNGTNADPYDLTFTIGTLNQNTTGSAATLTTARNINGVAFDGSANITVTAAGSTLSDTVPVSKGGTGATSFADKAVLITQDTGTDTVAAAAMSSNGQLLIGGTSGPAVATLTAGSNVTITNADGAITIAAAGGGGSSRSVAGDTDNGVMTWVTSDNTFAAEANLTFDGSTLTLAGVADITDTTDASDATGDTGALRCEGGASIAKKLYVGTDLDVGGTTNLDAVDIDGNVQLDGTLTVGVNDTGKDVKFYGATAGSYLEWDESEDRLHLVQGAYVNQPVPATGSTTENATLEIDLSKGNYFNILLGADITAVEFQNATIGQKFIIRFIQRADATAGHGISWSTVRINGSVAAELKWAGNIAPTMIGENNTSHRSHKDVYGFLCTATGGSANDTKFDGFIIGQDIPD